MRGVIFIQKTFPNSFASRNIILQSLSSTHHPHQFIIIAHTHTTTLVLFYFSFSSLANKIKSKHQTIVLLNDSSTKTRKTNAHLTLIGGFTQTLQKMMLVVRPKTAQAKVFVQFFSSSLTACTFIIKFSSILQINCSHLSIHIELSFEDNGILDPLYCTHLTYADDK